MEEHPDPRDIALAFVRHIVEGDFIDAWNLLATPARRQLAEDWWDHLHAYLDLAAEHDVIEAPPDRTTEQRDAAVTAVALRVVPADVWDEFARVEHDRLAGRLGDMWTRGLAPSPAHRPTAPVTIDGAEHPAEKIILVCLDGQPFRYFDKPTPVEGIGFTIAHTPLGHRITHIGPQPDLN